MRTPEDHEGFSGEGRYCRIQVQLCMMREEMNPVFGGFRDGVRRSLGATALVIARGWAREANALRETDFFSLRFFVSLEVVLFYFVGVVSLAVTVLPASPWVYAAVCGTSGVAGVHIIRKVWSFRRRRRN